jgi:hypothetical protein
LVIHGEGHAHAPRAEAILREGATIGELAVAGVGKKERD